jgi:elongation factor G
MRGKKSEEVKEIVCGDFGAIAKMEYKTGDTICDPKAQVTLPRISIPSPAIPWPLRPKQKGRKKRYPWACPAERGGYYLHRCKQR